VEAIGRIPACNSGQSGDSGSERDDIRDPWRHAQGVLAGASLAIDLQELMLAALSKHSHSDDVPGILSQVADSGGYSINPALGSEPFASHQLLERPPADYAGGTENVPRRHHRALPKAGFWFDPLVRAIASA